MNCVAVFTSLALLGILDLCQGHGRLRCPPGRSVMWRDGFNVPSNYQDNELNCGGRSTQWDYNDGKCGVCGDPYHEAIQENQPPYGKYAKSILTECYNSSSTAYIPTFVQITANHGGYVEFRLCPNNDFNKPVTQECLDRNVLRISDNKGNDYGTKFRLKSLYRDLHLRLEIPSGITCEQCVLQWRYTSGNSWGCDRGPRRRCGIGYGAQESFYSCADIAIVPDCNKVTVGVARSWSRSVCKNVRSSVGNNKPMAGNTKPKTTEKTEGEDDSSDSNSSKNNPSSKDSSKTDSTSSSSGKTNTKQGPKPPPGKINTRTERRCHAVGIWSNIKSMHHWCMLNCSRGNCPRAMCACLA